MRTRSCFQLLQGESLFLAKIGLVRAARAAFGMNWDLENALSLRLSDSFDNNHFQVYSILDEVFLAGEIEETSKNVVLTRLDHLDKME